MTYHVIKHKKPLYDHVHALQKPLNSNFLKKNSMYKSEFRRINKPILETQTHPPFDKQCATCNNPIQHNKKCDTSNYKCRSCDQTTNKSDKDEIKCSKYVPKKQNRNKKFKQIFQICNEQVDANNKHKNSSSEDTDFDARLSKSKCFIELQKNISETTRVAKAGSKIVERNLRLKLGHDLKSIIENLDKDKAIRSIRGIRYL
jgi:hypothetical protein